MERLRRRRNAAEDVADVLRDRILSGAVPAGERLPTQDQLVAEFDVSKAAVREACRILETEGLLNINRGNVGGATVHVPSATNVAYTLSQVLHSRHVDLADVRSTIGELEPLCAGLCAGRADRADAVLPTLDEAQTRLETCLERGDGSAAAVAARDWHEALARLCGLDTLAVFAGALEDVWSSHIREGLVVTEAKGWAPDPALSASVVAEHARINELIRTGDVDGASRAAAAHLHGRPRIHAEGGDVAQFDVRAGVVREQLFKR
jgi:GntR family transcriptional repressor for pyruvate dehydrogenase complex